MATSRALPQLSVPAARALWLRAQGLDQLAPFGSGPAASLRAIEHLGYVQIDTIHVIERAHHHILYTRIPEYRRSDLATLQTRDKSVFEYWTHALAYVPTRDFRYFRARMEAYRREPGQWLGRVKPEELRKVLRRIQAQGPLSIREFGDDALVEKDHEWASRKPSKRALQLGFYTGRLAVSERVGMLKTYEMLLRHFAWDKMPRAAKPVEKFDYLIDRALRSQAVVSRDSMGYLMTAADKAALLRQVQKRVKAGELCEVQFAGDPKTPHWMRTADAQRLQDERPSIASERVHLLSPFDPLVIQRKRFERFFGYEHRFEAYLPATQRRYGYFALPVLVGDSVVAVIDLKTDRAQQKLMIQKWSWLKGEKSPERQALIDEELGRFEIFQLAKS